MEVLGGQKIKSGKFHELPRKLIHFFNPPPRMERVRGGRDGGDTEGESTHEHGPSPYHVLVGEPPHKREVVCVVDVSVLHEA